MRRCEEERDRPWRAAALLALLLAAGPALVASTQPRPADAAPPPLVVNVRSDADGACEQPPAGDCSLREAITTANASAGPDRIHFRMPGKGVHTIRPQSALPTITEPVTIDGYTQPGAKPNTRAKGTNAVLRIALDGQASGLPHGLAIVGGQTTIRGLVIHGFVNCILVDTGPDNWGNVIEGNFIGTNPAGTASGSPYGAGVVLQGQASAQIGGEAPATRNLIAGDGGAGIALFPSTEGNFIEGNLLGTDRSGTRNLGDLQLGFEVVLDDTQAAGNWIQRNTIAFVGTGVVVSRGNSTRILANSIFAIEQIGIELWPPEGLNPNDPGDADGGANFSQNHPEIASAKANKRKTVVTGTLDSAPTRTFLLQFFANPADDPAGAKTLLATKSVTTDASGRAAFSYALKPVRRGRTITATASAGGVETSEISPPVTVKRLR